jgi:hypothetical protein
MLHLHSLIRCAHCVSMVIDPFLKILATIVANYTLAFLFVVLPAVWLQKPNTRSYRSSVNCDREAVILTILLIPIYLADDCIQLARDNHANTQNRVAALIPTYLPATAFRDLQAISLTDAWRRAIIEKSAIHNFFSSNSSMVLTTEMM